MSKNNGGPAFPCLHEGSTRSDASGMTLRDYFAAKAMTALISGAMAGGTKLEITSPPAFSTVAYDIADAMLAARDQ